MIGGLMMLAAPDFASEMEAGRAPPAVVVVFGVGQIVLLAGAVYAGIKGGEGHSAGLREARGVAGGPVAGRPA